MSAPGAACTAPPRHRAHAAEPYSARPNLACDLGNTLPVPMCLSNTRISNAPPIPPSGPPHSEETNLSGGSDSGGNPGQNYSGANMGAYRGLYAPAVASATKIHLRRSEHTKRFARRG